MAKLYQGETVITEYVTDVIPGYEVNKTTNRLLSGEWHTQIIGNGARLVAVNFICNLAEKNLVDEADQTGTPLKATGDNKYYLGVIRDTPSWSKTGGVWYATGITLLVDEEGSL